MGTSFDTRSLANYSLGLRNQIITTLEQSAGHSLDATELQHALTKIAVFISNPPAELIRQANQQQANYREPQKPLAGFTPEQLAEITTGRTTPSTLAPLDVSAINLANPPVSAGQHPQQP